ncbi:hypothetical protein HS5_01190 [Acidianus sp. HS-5]|nr:hypothetical protein HS5_01190 [Acidianus sp. HS-5]
MNEKVIAATMVATPMGIIVNVEKALLPRNSLVKIEAIANPKNSCMNKAPTVTITVFKIVPQILK